MRTKRYHDTHRDAINAHRRARPESKEYKRAWYARHRFSEQMREARRRAVMRQALRDRDRERRETDYEGFRVRDHRHRARKLGLTEHFSRDDIMRIFALQDGICFWCTMDLSHGYEVDHFVPTSRGGSNDADNIVLSCLPCNRAKSDRLPHEFVTLLWEKAVTPTPHRRHQ